MTDVMVQVFGTRQTRAVLVFALTDGSQRFIVGSPEDVRSEALPSFHEVWERASISPDGQAPGLRVRYVENGEPADADVEYSIPTTHVSVAADSKCYLCVCRPGVGDPVYVVFGSFRGRDWVYDPYTSEVSTIARLWLAPDGVWYESSGVPRIINSVKVYDYSTGRVVQGASFAGNDD